MSLTDNEILELNELCNAVVDGNLTDAQRARLSQWLAASEAARQFYVRALGLSASLHHYAAGMHAEAPDAAARPLLRPAVWWWAGSLAAAATLVLVFWLAPRPPPADPAVRPGAVEYVAGLTGARESSWAGPAAALRPGVRLHKGQRLELAGGFAEITFDCGARVILEGPASLDVNSAWDTTLRRGTLKASVPVEAIGFRISNPAVEVVDLGTEFTLIAEAGGSAEVLVLKGEVEAAPHDSTEQETVLLRENESRRFASSGMSDVSDSVQKFARFNRPVPLDRFTPSVSFVHWSFNEISGRVFRGRRLGATPGLVEAHLNAATELEAAAAHVAGRWQRALRFDGRLTVQTPLPGISGSAPRTVAFWVNVPEDAQLSDAYSMVAWRANSAKLAYRPVHIGWNRNPTEGALGALRTDFGGGHAAGTTSLRDGRWHHVAVVFAPGEDAATPVQVKQYLDGRLESSTIIPGKTRGPAGTPESALTDTLWLGCRLGNTGPRQDRFRGEMDELFVADRALEPHEIVQLMKTNQPAPPAAAMAVAHR